MKAHLWALIGAKNAPDAAIIRALTGADAEGYFDLMLANGQGLHMWTQPAAINESEKAPNAIAWTQSWLDYEKEWGPQFRYNGLAAFRMADGQKPDRTPQAYIEAFAKAGGHIESIVTLGGATPEWVRALGAPFAEAGINAPVNAIADRIRHLWGWL